MSNLESGACPVTFRQSKKVILATVVGNGLVIYDFTVFSFSAGIIGKLFFPSDSSFTSLLIALLTFGIGFAMRPLGAIVIGNLADRKGRKAGLNVSNLLMATGTALIAFMPTHASIGVTATVLLVISRLLQGFATGGEIGVSSVVLMELAPRDQRCYLVSWRSASQAAAALVGAVVGAATTSLLTPEQSLAWGWRIPFVLGLLIAPFGWFIRRNMVEIAPRGPQSPSLRVLLNSHRHQLLLGILMMAAPTASIYLMVLYMPTYLVRMLGLSPSMSLLSACISSAMLFIAAPLFARLADRLPRRKPTQYVTLILSVLLVYPVFLALTHGVGELVSLLIIGVYSVVAMGNNGVTTVMIMEAFPAHHRATGMSMVYSFGVTIFGAFCPFFVTWLIGITQNSMAPSWYLLGALLVSLFALVKFPVCPPTH
ncbi:MFS transporter [Pseudomonas sp. CCI1.2]|uniref:MFS transporter n=1 Tax=Pseudomonas sp. CCI1.2 TaxID=3048614 RepID=UPI002B223E41|nr:MFS transporter [Pseudomonas sp. CCI1.2]MEB0123209.1 MFS transporter [Pseudomonas sp. CCI1.2]